MSGTGCGWIGWGASGGEGRCGGVCTDMSGRFAAGDNFGVSVAADGYTVLVGGDLSDFVCPGSHCNAGEVGVFRISPRGGDLLDFARLQACFTGPNPTDIDTCCRLYDTEPDTSGVPILLAAGNTDTQGGSETFRHSSRKSAALMVMILVR